MEENINQEEVSRFPNIYRGIIVENSGLESKNGKCQVFVPGVYPEELKDSKDLPWAEPAMPLHGDCVKNSAKYVRPAIGATVWIFFDGGDHMKPVFFAASISGEWVLSDKPGIHTTATKSFIVINDESALQGEGAGGGASGIQIPGGILITNATADGKTNVTLVINGMLNVITTDGAFCNGMPVL